MKQNTNQPEGNYYDKYGSKNPFVRHLMKGFFSSLQKLLETSGILEGGNCLEAGCGEGYITDYVYGRVIEADPTAYFAAFDISERLIEVNKKKYQEIHFFSHNIYEPLDSHYLPEEGGLTSSSVVKC